MLRGAAIFLVLLCAVPAMAGDWQVRDMAHGLRDAILVDLAVSPANPDVMYLGTADGYVFVTRDGGRFWDEVQLVVGAGELAGGGRPSLQQVEDVAPADLLPGAAEAGIGRLDLRDAFYFDHGATGDEFLEAWDRPSAYDAADVPGLPPVGELAPGANGGSGDVGGTGGAGDACEARLRAALEEFEQWDWGLGAFGDVDELSVVRSRVTFIAAHPTDETIALASTLSGVYRTDDTGRTWYPIAVGFGRWDRGALHLAFDPIDPLRVYLGTQKGIFLSTDGGLSFFPAVRTSAESAWTHWIEASAAGGKVQLVAATAFGALVSLDQGRTWRWMRFEGVEDTDYVTCAAVDPHDPRHIYLASLEGIDESSDGGRTWKEAGGLQLTGTAIYRLVIDSRRAGHLLVTTDRDVWESDDGGTNWRNLYIDDGPFKVRRPLMVPGSDDFIILTSGRVLRFSRQQPDSGTTAFLQAESTLWEQAMAAEPTESTMLAAVFAHMGVDAGQHRRLRERASRSHLLPELSLLGGYFSAGADANLSVIPWLRNSGVALDRVFGLDRGYGSGYVALMAWWDLSALVFTLDEVPRGRGQSAMLDGQTALKYEVARYYEERLRTMRSLIFDRPAEPVVLMDLALRYRELTEHLDALTGGLYARQVRELCEGGVKWLAGVLY